VGYGEIQRDTELDTARYVRFQLDTVGYSGIQWICCKIDRYRIDTGMIHGMPRTKDMVRYTRNTQVNALPWSSFLAISRFRGGGGGIRIR